MNNYKKQYMPIFGLLFGGIVFLIIYGYKILDPAFIEWTMTGDAAQHFLGWHFFRSESWQFPLGLIKSFQYPQGTSLVYTDSIPLLAIPLKLLSPLLPPIFQYHGLWLLLCYLLQGYFAFLLLRQITDRPIVIVLGVLFFLLSPVMIQRSGGHEALAGHWLIIASLYLYFQKDILTSRIKWLGLLVISLMVHFYLFSMAFLILSGYLLKKVLEDYKNNWLPVIKLCILSLAVSIISMWIIGYFVIDIENSTVNGFGYYSMNLISPINPMDTSAFLKSFPLATGGQYEGYNYLGFGLLLLILVSIYTLPRQDIFLAAKNHLPLIFVALILLLISLSNKITFSNIVLFEISLPYMIEKFFGIFRSSGRMFWPVTYILILAAIAILIKYNSSKRVFIFLFIFISIQTIDLFPLYKNINYDKMSWTSPLQSPLWNKLVESSEQIVLIPATIDGDDYVAFALLAANYGKTINVGYTARTDHKARRIYDENLRQEFQDGKLIDNALYILRSKHLYAPSASSGFHSITLDGYAIITQKNE